MKDFRYIPGVVTLELDEKKCIGCGMCETVCPHGVVVMDARRVRMADRDGCMECGACAMNCPAGAITVRPGVGCAAAVIMGWIGKFTKSKKGLSCC